MSFSLLLKIYRESENLTVMDLAEKTGLTEEFIYEIESGRTMTIRTKQIRAICDALGIPMSQLVTSDDPRTASMKLANVRRCVSFDKRATGIAYQFLGNLKWGEAV